MLHCAVHVALVTSPVDAQEFGPCPKEDPTGWGYMAVGLKVAASGQIEARWTAYPSGMIATCFFIDTNSSGDITIAYKFPRSTPAGRFPFSSAIEGGGILVAGAAGRDDAWPTECTPNRFPKGNWTMHASESCRELPPWCSSELDIDFSFHFTSPKSTDVFIPINCLKGGPGSPPHVDTL